MTQRTHDVRRWWPLSVLLVVTVGLAGCARSVTGSATPLVGVTTSPSIGDLTALFPTTSSAGPTGSSGGTTDGSETSPSGTGTGSATTVSTADTTGSTATTSGPQTTASRTPAASSASSATTTYRTSWVLGSRTTAAAKNQYGDAKAKIGQVLGLTWTDSHQDVIAFIVDSITVDKGCAAGTPKATNGHLVVLTMRIEVRNSTLQQLDDGQIDFSKSNWTAYDASGTAQTNTHSSAADDCVLGHSVPVTSELSVSAVNAGKIAFDVSGVKGTVVLNLPGIEGGWEFGYG